MPEHRPAVESQRPGEHHDVLRVPLERPGALGPPFRLPARPQVDEDQPDPPFGERIQVVGELVMVEARTAVQYEQNGTGHAVRMALEELGGSVDGTVIVVCGDTPLLTGATLKGLAEAHHGDGNAVTVLTAEVPDATGYGRIVRDAVSGAVTAIVEHKDASAAQRAIRQRHKDTG